MATKYLQIFTSHMGRVISSYLHANQEEENQILTSSTYYMPDTVHILKKTRNCKAVFVLSFVTLNCAVPTSWTFKTIIILCHSSYVIFICSVCNKLPALTVSNVSANRHTTD